MIEPALTLRQWVDWATDQLNTISDTPRLDAKILYKHASDFSDIEIITRDSEVVPSKQAADFIQLVRKRLAGTPVAYITGQKEFWSMNLTVTTDTLIPRPETELLVELALEKIQPERSVKILDLGTGCGAIALAIAHERPDACVYAIDQSKAALKIAAQNAADHALGNIKFIHSSWFDSLDHRDFDLIASNPPYIDVTDAHLSLGDVRFEPKAALISENHGLNDIQKIINQAPEFLKHQGWLFIEHGFGQEQRIAAMFNPLVWRHLKCINDLNHQPRVSYAQYSPNQ